MSPTSEQNSHDGDSGDDVAPMEFWMTNLPQKLRSTPIIYLAIPGSHDSMTYSITSRSKLSPDAEPAIRRFRFFGPLFTAIVARWSRTQAFDVDRQLQNGVRYFDLRIATKAGNDSFYFVHGLYADEVGPIFQQIRSFLETHPREVVILDCQHFFAFQQSDHERLMRLLTATYGHKLLPYTPHMEHISLEYMTTQFRYQVIVIYRSDAARFGQPLLWPAMCFPTPWPNTVSIPRLMTFLDERLKHRPSSMGFVSQCVLTPDSWFVVKYLFSSLKKQCVLPLEKAKYRWLNKQVPGGPNGINIVISDYVECQDGLFAKEVISLNEKLLPAEKSNSSDKLTPVDGSI